MRVPFIFLAAFIAFSKAGTLYGCAGVCVGHAIVSTGCSSANSGCICSSELFVENVSQCAAKSCNQEEQDNAVSLVQDFCYKIGLAKRGTEEEEWTQKQTKAFEEFKTRQDREHPHESEERSHERFREWQHRKKEEYPWWHWRHWSWFRHEHHHRKPPPPKHHTTHRHTTTPHHYTHTTPHTHTYTHPHTVCPHGDC